MTANKQLDVDATGKRIDELRKSADSRLEMWQIRLG